MGLTNIEKELVKSAKESFEDFINEQEGFWTKEYPKYSFRKKVNFLLPTTHHSMRIAGETTGNEYNYFSKEIYDKNKELEPNFDEIFNAVIPRLQNFDVDEYKKRITL